MTASTAQDPLLRQRRRALLVGVALVVALVALVGMAPRIVETLAPSVVGAIVSGDGDGGDAGGRLGEEDGVIATGQEPSPFDESHPGVTRLDPALLAALRAAAGAASAEGIALVVNSGWRSEAYQQQLWEDAIAEHGSEEEAARWVSPPDESAHVTGDAVDVGPWEGADWLARNGAAWGLCQTFDNEPWHFELREDAVLAGCPPPAADPTSVPLPAP